MSTEYIRVFKEKLDMCELAHIRKDHKKVLEILGKYHMDMGQNYHIFTSCGIVDMLDDISEFYNVYSRYIKLTFNEISYNGNFKYVKEFYRKAGCGLMSNDMIDKDLELSFKDLVNSNHFKIVWLKERIMRKMEGDSAGCYPERIFADVIPKSSFVFDSSNYVKLLSSVEPEVEDKFNKLLKQYHDEKYNWTSEL